MELTIRLDCSRRLLLARMYLFVTPLKHSVQLLQFEFEVSQSGGGPRLTLNWFLSVSRRLRCPESLQYDQPQDPHHFV